MQEYTMVVNSGKNDDIIKITVLDAQDNIIYLRYFNLERFGDEFFEISNIDTGAQKMFEILYGIVEQDIVNGLNIYIETVDIYARQLLTYCYYRAKDLEMKSLYYCS